MKERPVPTSIYLLPSKIDELKKIAFEQGYNSRNELISDILTKWLEKNKKS